MSPDQAAGDREIDGRSDIYSLGVVTYQMLAGELPFQAPTVPGILMKHITERAPLITDRRPEVPEDLAACVMRSLEKDPEDRWPTADALRRALEARSATLYKPRRSSGPSPSRGVRAPPPPALPPLRGRPDRLAQRAQRVDRPRATTDEFGGHAEPIRQARSDRKAILRIVDRLPKSERKMLPDVVATADALLNRAEELARTLHAMSGTVDRGALARLEEKIQATKHQGDPGLTRRPREGGSTERDRQVGLLERQRQALTDLLTRRQLVADQLESCVLAMQNVRFDLLRLRSAGVAVALDDLTRATQQARALSRDVDHVIAAAGEIKNVLGEQTGA